MDREGSPSRGEEMEEKGRHKASLELLQEWNGEVVKIDPPRTVIEATEVLCIGAPIGKNDKGVEWGENGSA